MAPDETTSAPVIIVAPLYKAEPMPAAAQPEWELNMNMRQPTDRCHWGATTLYSGADFPRSKFVVAVAQQLTLGSFARRDF